MRYPLFTIAYFTLLEAWRATRVFVPVFILILAASFFVRELAIIEAPRFQSVFLGAVMRLALVFILSLYVIVSVVREFNDKGLEVILALDVTRSNYVLGKFLGYAAVAFALCALTFFVLLAFLDPMPLSVWSGFLFLELIIVVAFSLFAATAFASVVPAASAVLGFYLLARSIATLQLISDGALALQNPALKNVVSGFVKFIGLFIPRLSDFTQTAWLVNDIPSGAVALSLITQGVLFLAVVLAAAVFDFHRKDF